MAYLDCEHEGGPSHRLFPFGRGGNLLEDLSADPEALRGVPLLALPLLCAGPDEVLT
jgi:hypothetical protein